MEWQDVCQEMVEKGISKECAESIGEYVRMKGDETLVQKLLSNDKLTANLDARKSLEEMAVLFRYCKATGITDQVRT